VAQVIASVIVLLLFQTIDQFALQVCLPSPGDFLPPPADHSAPAPATSAAL